MVLISRKEKRLIMQNLFKEGVMVVEKNPRKGNHDELAILNLKVFMLCRSLESKGYLMSKFNWQWNYYFLLDEGIEYLREVLGLPATAQPDTWTKPRPTRMTGESSRSKGKGKGKGKGWKGEERP